MTVVDDYRTVLADALRALIDPAEMQVAAARVLGEHLGASRVHYSEVSSDGEYVTVASDYHAGVPSAAGRYRLDDFWPTIVDEARAGRTLVVSNVAEDPRLSTAERERTAALATGAYVTFPLFKAGRMVALLAVHHAEPHAFAADELAAIEETAERTWAAVERAKAEHALRASEERLRLALDAAGMGSFIWHPEEDRGEPDDRMLALFGLPEDSTLTLASALATMIHPADRDGYAAAVGRAVDPSGDGELLEEIRVVQPGGAERWLLISGRTAFGGEPRRALRMAGVAADVTERKRAESVLRESEERFRLLADNAPVLIWLNDERNQATYMNAEYVRFLGRPLDDLLGGGWRESLHPDDAAAYFDAFAEAAARRDRFQAEFRFRRSDGEYRWMRSVGVPRYEGGRYLGYIGSTSDVHERRQVEEAHRRAQQQAELLAAVVGELEAVDGVGARARRLVELLVPRFARLAAVELPGRSPVLASLGQGEAAIRLPLPLGANLQGTLALGFDSARPVPAHDRSFAREIAERAGLLLGNARLQEEEHQIALRLQRALLPDKVLERPEVAIAARYEAGSAGLEVGGDWYDSFVLADGRIGLAVGDVVGHGLDAAAAMGRLRTALVALAAQTDSPARLLTALDDFASGPNGAQFATACYAILDPSTGELRYASAAHPPMLVLTPAGEARWLYDGRSLPLGGVSEATRPEASVVLDPDALLVLYSDGLVERRREPLDVGLARLERAAKARPGASVDELCDRIVTALGADSARDDDAVVMCVRLVPVAARSFRRAFLARPAELSRLRAAVDAWLADHGLSDRVRLDLQLALGEACSNAVEHAYRGRAPRNVEVEIREDGPDLLVRVRDFGRWKPPAGSPDNRGFGSSIMRKLTRDFEREAGVDGTTVSFRIARASEMSA